MRAKMFCKTSSVAHRISNIPDTGYHSEPHEQNRYMSLTFSQMFSRCHLSWCHVFERSYRWLTTNIFVLKLERYSFNINADYRVFSELLSAKRTAKNEQATKNDEEYLLTKH